MKCTVTSLLAAAVASLFLAGAPVQAMDRSKIPDQDKWDLSDVYPTDAAWESAKKDLEKRLPEVDRYKGKLGSSPKELLGCMNLLFDLKKEFSRLATYASQKSDLDVRDAHAMEMRQSLDPLGAEFGARTAWVDPEILEIPSAKIEAFLKEEPGLAIYKPVIEDIVRLKPHTLSPAEEKIMADASLVSGTPDSIFSVFSDADNPRATVTLSDGETVKLDASAYTKYRAVPNRWDRESVFQAFFGNLDQFKGTYGALLNGEVDKDLFFAKARNYKDCLSSALDGPNIPTVVYTNLLRNVHKNLPTLWRYLKLRQRIMGLDQLRYSDLYAPIIKEVDEKYTADQAKDLVLKAVAPLGQDYVDVLKNGYAHRWVDFYPSPGKHSGAYSNGAAYDVHPFMLLNFNGSYEDVSTLAHESGHTMHSYYSNKTQPFATSDYTIFVAEVASTCNENLLMDYMLKHTDSDAMKLFLLGSYVDNIRQTLFRQAQFAEFELKIHQMVESGQPLTGENLNKAYAGIINEYYGVPQGITEINPVCYSEWAFIPHFYYNFYVYSYATSITASTAISQMIMEGKPDAVKDYRKFLTLGSSLPPVEELKVAGVDMTTDVPFDITMKAMNRAMDQMEAILNKMDAQKKAAPAGK